MNRQEILHKAIGCYGEAAQVDICVEEMSELTKALLKWRRSGTNADELLHNIREEIADVQIMLDQMRMIYGSTADEETFKLERLEKRLDGSAPLLDPT